MKDLAIVIPCYNEATRLPVEGYRGFLNKKKNIHLLFVNDGSKDQTLTVLQSLADEFPEQVKYFDLPTNKGKAEAVRAGIQKLADEPFEKLAYLDADLATSLEECEVLSKAITPDIQFVFGSRILKIDNHIQRKWYRFVIGRIVATVISWMLGIKVYDTQCGCKIFKRDLAQELFHQPFISKWLFDVELFFRMIRKVGRHQMGILTKEVPLKRWVDTEDSRVEFRYIFVLWLDLIKIYKTYR